MMNERQRARELEQLSAYLDGQLNEIEKRQVESRLSSEPELREKYDGLRKTKLLFSRIPRVRAPRSFALTPEMVKVRKTKRPFITTVRWATSVAAILLVVTFGAEFLLSNPFMAQSAMPATERLEAVNTEMQDEAALADEAAAPKAVEPEPLIIWGAPGMGGGGSDTEAYGIGGAGGGDVAEEAAPTEETPEAGIMRYTQENSPTDLPTQVETDSAVDGETPILGINTDQAGEIVSTSEEAAEAPDTSWLSTLSPFRWAEIGLAVIALAGVLILLIRKFT
jgi:hypothetical protein